MEQKCAIPVKNVGQVLKETAIKRGIDNSSLEHSSNTTPTIRKHKWQRW